MIFTVSRKKLPRVDDEELQKILDAKRDEAPSRRRAHEAFKDIQLGIDHILFKVTFCDVGVHKPSGSCSESVFCYVGYFFLSFCFFVLSIDNSILFIILYVSC